MRTLFIIALVVAGMAAAIRIEGVWPPEPVRQYVEQTVRQVMEPGEILRSLLRERLPKLPELRPTSGVPERLPLIRAVADRHGTGAPSGGECS